jgi:hypothetical protein
MALKEWVRLPTDWINSGGLKAFRWEASKGSNNTAALMCLMVLAHYTNSESGFVIATYDNLELSTGLSRAKISAGLNVLQNQQIIERNVLGHRSRYALKQYEPIGWAKLPAKRLYHNHTVAFFSELHLRKPAELNALKLYFLIVARRGRDTNLANISYDKIHEYSGIDRNRIKSALSLLIANGMVHVERVPSDKSDYGVANAYRLPQIEPYTHMGTQGRAKTKEDYRLEFSDPF